MGQRSLKLVPFESLSEVSYLPSIVTMAISVAICEIFSVKKWRDLENQVRGRSRSLKMAPFDRPYATFYWSAIVAFAFQGPPSGTHSHKTYEAVTFPGNSSSVDLRHGCLSVLMCRWRV